MRLTFTTRQLIGLFDKSWGIMHNIVGGIHKVTIYENISGTLCNNLTYIVLNQKSFYNPSISIK